MKFPTIIFCVPKYIAKEMKRTYRKEEYAYQSDLIRDLYLEYKTHYKAVI